MARAVIATSTVAAAMAAATVSLQIGKSHSSSGTSGHLNRNNLTDSAAEVRQGVWRRLPSLPGRRTTDIDGGALASAGGSLYAAVVARSANHRPSRIRVYRLVASRWRLVGGRGLPLDQGSMFTLLGGARLCVVAPYGGDVSTRCARRRGRRWMRLGGAVFRTQRRNSITVYAGAFSDGGRIYVLRAHLQHARVPPGGVSVEGRLEHTVYRLRRGRWERVGGDIDPSSPGGTQRPFGVTLRGRPCIAYDRIGTDPHVGPTLNLACLEDDAWRPAQMAPLTDADVAAQQPAQDINALGTTEPRAINVDGIAVFDGTVYIGVDYFVGTWVGWPVFRYRDGKWQLTSLGGSAPGWNSQGSMYALENRLWVTRFDQRDAADSPLRTRLVVRTMDPATGQSWTVGQPLVRDAKFYGPLYWGLASARHQMYAAATVPIPRLRRNEFAVFALERRTVR